MSSNEWYIVIGLTAIGTWLLRALPFMVKGFDKLDKQVVKFLVSTSLAITAGLVSNSLFKPALHGEYKTFLIGIFAVMMAVVVHKKSGNIPLSLFGAIITATLIYRYF